RIGRDDIAITPVIVTHGHADHVVDVGDLAERFGVPVLAHEITAKDLGEGRVDEMLADGDAIGSGGLEI
ncbi:MAG: MBL fold metallo-hydrolase, partial [Thermoleophilaceae bacterium]